MVSPLNSLRSVSLLALFTVALSASAQITAVGEFSGALNEGFEGFPNFLESRGSYLPNPTAIMGGAATFSAAGNNALIYEPGRVSFNINNTPAQVHSGAKGLGLNDLGATATITFASLVQSFGG